MLSGKETEIAGGWITFSGLRNKTAAQGIMIINNEKSSQHAAAKSCRQENHEGKIHGWSKLPWPHGATAGTN